MQLNLLFSRHVMPLVHMVQLTGAQEVEQNDGTGQLSSNASLDIRYKLFWTLWPVATLFHMATNRVFADGMHYMMLSLAAVLLMLKPASTARILFFLALQLYEASRTFQVISNHWIFSTFVNLTILHTLFYLLIKRRSFRINRIEFFKTFAPLVRLEVIILYFYVVLHKLNTGFFTPQGSCATDFLTAQDVYGILPTTETAAVLSAYGTVAIEALIPLLLCFKKTRNWGVWVGLCFHFFIAYNPLNGFYDFSSMLFAVYILFTGDKFSSQVHFLHKKVEEYKTLGKRNFHRFSLPKLVSILVMLLVAMLVLDFLAKQFDDFFRHICWTAYGVTFITVFSKVLFSEKPDVDTSGNFFTVRHLTLLLFPLFVFINGMSPYLGLKTESSFAMFSNLRTEGGISNHLFIPAQAQMFDFQKDVVEVVFSSDRKLQRFAEINRMFVYADFKEYIREVKPKRVDYIRKGKRHTYSASLAKPTDALNQRPSFLYKKFLRFRTFNKYEPQPCAH